MAAADPSHRPCAIQFEVRTRGLALLAALATLAFLLAAPPARAQNLIHNGSFTAGEGDLPLGWKTDQWTAQAGTVFEWKHPESGLGAIVVRNPKANDARWTQTVRVEPERWYRLAGYLRAINVDRSGAGASLSPLEGFDRGQEVKGPDSGWQPVALWFKTQPAQTTVTIACRLGTFGTTAAGEAWCTGVELTAQAAPPLNADFVYGPVEESTTPVGLPASLFLIALLAYGIARYGRLPAEVALRERLLLDATLLAILAVKIIIAPRFQYKIDVNAYAAWALKLAEEGPARFYAPGYFADYPPGYMYVLWWIGLASRVLRIAWGTQAFIILLKLPALLADLAIGRLLFARLRSRGGRLAWLACLAFSLNPALVLDSAVWGQTDSVLGLLTLLAFLAQGERRFEISWMFAALAVLTKPQALLLVPLLALWPFGWWKSGRPVSTALAALATVFVVADPFRGEKAWRWLYDLYGGTAGYYAETSVNAMNAMALLFGMRHSDADRLLGVSAQMWGFGLGGAIGLAFLVPYLWRRTRTLHASLFASATLVSFLCLTRMHERYLYPYFVFAVLLGVTGFTGVVYWALSALFFVNELAVYVYQEGATAGPEWLWGWVSVLNLGCLAAWLLATWRIAQGRLVPPGAAALDDDDTRPEPTAAELPRPTRSAAPGPEGAGEPSWLAAEVLFLLAVTLIAGALRIYEITQPTDLVFDEVYFVEQGRNYIKGVDFMDPHPPIAKLSIALGIELLGDNPLGWRAMNAAVGTALVPLMYLLARALLRRRVAAGLAAFFVAIDGLCIVDSRIAVIDIHYVTWAVAAYLVLIRTIRKNALDSVWRLIGIGALIGLSLGAKLYIPFWSFLLVLGTVAVCARDAAQRAKRPLLVSTLRPVVIVGASASAIYALSFAPHFLWGWWHSPLDLVKYIFIKVPEYEAAVKDATHPYSSKWWSWPLLLRPVWYYWKDPSAIPGMVVGIWGAGNPPLWWATVPALLFAAWTAVRDRSGGWLAFIVAGWLIHFVPWIGIGRTLFLYHYLPSLLFAFLALAWLLDRLWNGEGSALERGLVGAAVLASLLAVAVASGSSWGTIGFLLLLLAYEGLVFSGGTEPVQLGRAAVAIYCLTLAGVSIYFLPIWLGEPISKQAWQAHMWISSFGNWI